MNVPRVNKKHQYLHNLQRSPDSQISRALSLYSVAALVTCHIERNFVISGIEIAMFGYSDGISWNVVDDNCLIENC